ncbi:DUF1934 family protein [Candidatus Mycoplasma mahonii]|uniref:DUF1934 family protein n=1 Tax=Candidatus Mycoplasma mahonii TaxID=3004105 RepID=UPI0026F13895|nr:DUF1934 family protein [Candidatus Mycoplasma mahonii]WKX02490.1 DUF1934 family protein [Candidatus Mycoplasma mahonii]
MTLTFTSNIEQNGQKNKIEFSSEVQVTREGNFKIYEFQDPSSGVFNRVEISNKFVNIFAGPSTINIALNKSLDNAFQTPAGLQTLNSYMTELKSGKGVDEFTYTLSLNGTLFGKYNITLLIK